MTPERYQLVGKLYRAAQEIAPEQRAHFLAQACGDDRALKEEIESLLAYNTRSEGFIDRPAIQVTAEMLAAEQVNSLPGRQISHYQILSLLGRGGMGDVYRARDARLGRDVALKVLPIAYASDADRLRRFEQEARSAGRLNHPNVVTVYDVGVDGGAPYIVAELLEGDELRAHLNQGRIPQPRALDYARQMASGLAAAHGKGIVHRDLKPENIFVTTDGRVKILDFGLAKLTSPISGSSLETNPQPVTTPGVVMGTVGYMSPEQVRGQETDERSDIFALGVILYEMLSGKRTFPGESAVEVMNAILKEDPPDLGETNAKNAPVLERIVRRCLEKKPDQRFQSASDLCFALEALSSTSTPSARVEKRVVAAKVWPGVVWVAALAMLAAIAVWFVARRGAVSEPGAVTTRSFIGPVAAPRFQPFGARYLAISNDGTRLAYISGAQVFLRPMNRTQAFAVGPDSRTVTVTNPFFSFDGQWLAFSQFYDLKKAPVNGGAVVSIATFKGRNFGGTWAADGTIIFSTETGLFSVSDQGGEPKLLMAPEREGVLFVWPEFIPGRHSLLFTKLPTGSVEAAEIVLLDLKTLKSTVVARGGTGAHYFPDGYLLYATRRGLEATTFNPDTGTASTDSVLIPDVDVKIATDNGAADFAVSGNGTLVHMPPVTARLSQLVWVDLEGREEVISTIAPGAYSYPRLSPDGKRVAVDIPGPNRDVYVLDLERGSRVRLSEGPNEDLLPIWSSDGRRVYYASNRGGFHVYSRAADGTGSEELLIDNADVQMPEWLAPGNRMLFFKGPYEAADFGSVNLDHPTSIEWLLHSKYTERHPAVSPDGNWIAYDSDESGQNGVWVRPYPNVDKARIPIGPGLHPRWAPRGNELYYRNPEWGMMAVSVQLSPEFHAGTPRLLFPNNRYGTGGGVGYDVASDGRFLMTQAIGETGNSQIMISVALNWRGELKTLLRH